MDQKRQEGINFRANKKKNAYINLPKLSSPGPKPLAPKLKNPKTQKPKTKGPWADTKISWATTPPLL